DDIVPIPGTRRIERLDENAAATRLRLSEGELQGIAQVLEQHRVAGLRYPEPGMASMNRLSSLGDGSSPRHTRAAPESSFRHLRARDPRPALRRCMESPGLITRVMEYAYL